MVYEFKLPDIGEGVAEGEVVQWFVKEGDTVAEDAPLVSVLTDKANVEIPSPRGGRVVRLHAQVGEKVKVGGLLVSIDDGSGGGPAAPSEPSAPPAGPPAEAAAVPPPPPPPPDAAAAPPARPAAETSAQGRLLASPFVRKLAAERGIDLSTIRGSGPGGRIVESDLGARDAPAAPSPTPDPSATVPTAPASGAPVRGSPPSADPRDVVERVPIRGVRRVIAERMTEANQRSARFTYVEEVEATELMRLREQMAKHVEKHGTKLSFLPFIVKAVVEGLREHPWMNARIDDATHELLVYKTYNIGIATAAPEGLVVPVVHRAESKSLTQIAQEIQALAERARAGKLTLPELTGGTFTITSLGALGGVLATPILNYPEVAILGVHKIQKRPVYLPDGSIGPGQLMNLSVSLDHRVIDGIVGAQFLAVVKALLEEPHQLFAHAV